MHEVAETTASTFAKKFKWTNEQNKTFEADSGQTRDGLKLKNEAACLSLLIEKCGGHYDFGFFVSYGNKNRWKNFKKRWDNNNTKVYKNDTYVRRCLSIVFVTTFDQHCWTEPVVVSARHEHFLEPPSCASFYV